MKPPRAKLAVRARGHFSPDRANDIRTKPGCIACGEEAERLAREIILPLNDCDPVTGRSELVHRKKVPFDIIAKHQDEFWLVEVKVRSPDEPRVDDVQQRRMLKLRSLLSGAGITVVPMLLWIDHWGAMYELMDFPTPSREFTGKDDDLPDLAERVADWVKRVRVKHPIR